MVGILESKEVLGKLYYILRDVTCRSIDDGIQQIMQKSFRNRAFVLDHVKQETRLFIRSFADNMKILLAKMVELMAERYELEFFSEATPQSRPDSALGGAGGS